MPVLYQPHLYVEDEAARYTNHVTHYIAPWTWTFSFDMTIRWKSTLVTTLVACIDSRFWIFYDTSWNIYHYTGSSIFYDWANWDHTTMLVCSCCNSKMSTAWFWVLLFLWRLHTFVGDCSTTYFQLIVKNERFIGLSPFFTHTIFLVFVLAKGSRYRPFISYCSHSPSHFPPILVSCHAL